MIGHGDQITDQVPRQIKCLNRVIIKKVSAGGNNAAAITYNGIIFTWGQNNKGQCGRGIKLYLIFLVFFLLYIPCSLYLFIFHYIFIIRKI
jgi:alpha-tubulin suppressor-like RCC1 family protein